MTLPHLRISISHALLELFDVSSLMTTVALRFHAREYLRV